MKLVPLYRTGPILIIGSRDDFGANPPKDGLVLKVNLAKGSLLAGPWSLQLFLKFGSYEPVSPESLTELLCEMSESFTSVDLTRFQAILDNPDERAINSLVWIPERLRQ